MKQKSSDQPFFQIVFGDRWLAGLCVVNLLLLAIILLSLLLSVQPKETQVIVQYSSYGVTSYYRGHWYSLWSYGLLALIMVCGHTALSVRLVRLQRRSLALALLWFTIGLMVVLFLLARSIINIAALG